MYYLLKRFPKIPYTLAVALSEISWAALCAAFGYFFILSYANFEATGTRMVFIFSFPLYLIAVMLLVIMQYGGLRLFGIREKRKELRILNDNIKAGHLASDISTETLKKIFYSLVERPEDGFKVGLKYGGLVILLSLVTEWLASGKTTNLFIILISGLISVCLLIIFATFFAQSFIFPTLQECRALLAKRGGKVQEPRIRFGSLKAKFNLFLLIPIVVVLTILGLVSAININIILFTLLGLVMAIMISKTLSFPIYEAFLGIRNFARELPIKKRTVFSTGSLDREIIDLSESLNQAASEVYTVRQELEKAKTVLEIKVRARTKELKSLAKSLEAQVERRTRELEEAKTVLEIKVRARTKELSRFNERLEEKVRERTEELQRAYEDIKKKKEDLEKFYKLTVGREVKMIELKKEIKQLKERLAEKEK